MVKNSQFKAKKSSVDMPCHKKTCDGTMMETKTLRKGTSKKAINTGLVSDSPKKHETEVHTILKSTLKKKKKRNLVAANDPTYADCFSDAGDDIFEEGWRGSSLDKTVKFIMSAGGSVQPNEALLRPKKAVKRKRKIKNSSAGNRQINLNESYKSNEEYSIRRNAFADSFAVDHCDDGCPETLAPVKKKQRKETCSISDARDNKSSFNNQPCKNTDVSIERKGNENCSISKKFKKKKKASNTCDGKVTEMKNGSVMNIKIQSCNDEVTVDTSTLKNSVPKLMEKKKEKKKKKFKEIDPSNSEISEITDQTFNLCDLPASIVNCVGDETVRVGNSNTLSDVPACIHSNYSCKSFCKKFCKSWCGKNIEDWPASGVVLHTPFNCAHLPNFISSDSDFLGRLTKELHGLPFTCRDNDIFQFRQSRELPLSGACLELRRLLTGPVRDWLTRCTRLQLADTVDLSASLYLHSDVLLCHDDELEGRRIAFILYLTDPSDTWLPSDGGTLDLFDGEPGLAGRVVRRLPPHHNTFAFFEVSPLSFHQVAEVLCPRKARLSVSGWFHGAPLDYPPRPLRPCKRFLPPGDIELDVLYSWVSPEYRTDDIMADIRRQLEEDSEIQLENFFVPQKFEELSAALRAVDSWQWVGPPTAAHYQVCGAAVPDVVREFLAVVRSEAFFLVLSQLSGVGLHHLAPPDDDDDDDDDDDGENDDKECSSDDNDGSEAEKPETQILKRVLKDHKKKHELRASKTLNPDVSFGLDEKWSYDLGVPRLASATRPDPGDSAQTGGVSGAAAPHQKEAKKKKLKRAKLEQNEAGKSNEELSSSSNMISEESSGQENCASVFSSIRRLSHGCYSLLRDAEHGSGAEDSREKLKERNGALAAERVGGRHSGGGRGKGEGQAGEAGEALRNQDDITEKKDTMVSVVGGMKSKKKSIDPRKEEKGGKTSKDSQSKDDGDYVLDVSLFCNVPDDWNEGWGGHTFYVDQQHETQLLSVVPQNNTLALVYRDHRTQSFIKHINVASRGACFHQIFCQYKER